MITALWYFSMNLSVNITTSTDVKKATEQVNGGYNGLSDGKNMYSKAISILNNK